MECPIYYQTALEVNKVRRRAKWLNALTIYANLPECILLYHLVGLSTPS